MNLQVGDLLRYFDGSENHLCYIVVATYGEFLNNKDQQTCCVEWITERGKRDFNPKITFTLGDFSYGGWIKLS